jgi:transcriptional regulator with XRE-family HTH domain
MWIRGDDMRGKPYPPGTINTARALRREGKSIRTIAAELGVPRATVGDWLRGFGEPMYVKTCWCGQTFVSRLADAKSCSRAHMRKRWRLYGRVSRRGGKR